MKARYEEVREENQALDTENKRLDSEKVHLIQESLQRDKDYSRIVREVNRRLGDSCEDRKSFVTPSDPAVTAKVLAITGGYSADTSEEWADYYRLYDWVTKNIKYSHDSPLPELPPAPASTTLSWQQDYWRTPSETLQDETGDCEDMACLLASMMLNYTSDRYPVWVITWASPAGGHAAIAFPVAGGKLTVLDPAGNFFTRNPVPFGSIGSQPVATAVTQWIDHWSSSGYPGASVNRVFSDTECETFVNTDKFVLWVAEQFGSR